MPKKKKLIVSSFTAFASIHAKHWLNTRSCSLCKVHSSLPIFRKFRNNKIWYEMKDESPQRFHALLSKPISYHTFCYKRSPIFIKDLNTSSLSQVYWPQPSRILVWLRGSVSEKVFFWVIFQKFSHFLFVGLVSYSSVSFVSLLFYVIHKRRVFLHISSLFRIYFLFLLNSTEFIIIVVAYTHGLCENVWVVLFETLSIVFEIVSRI